MSEKTESALELAILFHVIYERKSAEFNYVTRTETRIFDPESKNGKLMIATCEEILEDYAPRAELAELRAERDDLLLINADLRATLDRAIAWHEGDCKRTNTRQIVTI